MNIYRPRRHGERRWRSLIEVVTLGEAISRPADVRELEYAMENRCIYHKRKFCSKIAFGCYLHRQSFAVDADHGFLMTPYAAQEGDIVCAIFGCGVPVVLRPCRHRSGSEFYKFIGNCYVEKNRLTSIMDQYLDGEWPSTYFDIE